MLSGRQIWDDIFSELPFPTTYQQRRRDKSGICAQCILVQRKTLFFRISPFKNALYGKGNAKSYLASCSMSFWNYKLVFEVLPAVFLMGIAWCHYLEIGVAILNTYLSSLCWKGAKCHINYALCSAFQTLLSSLGFACWIEEKIDSCLGLFQSHLKTAKSKLNPSQMGGK